MRSYDPENGNAKISPMLTVNVIEVNKQHSHETEHSYLGKVEARRSTNLGFEIAGLVKKILVREGQKIQTNQTLALLDVDHLLARRQEILAEMTRASAIHELTRITKDRTIEASQLQAVSEIDKDQADQNFLAQEAALKGVISRLNQINIEIAKGTLKAPYSGVIGKRYLDEGTVVEEGNQVLQLVETDQLEARIGIKNPQSLSVGQSVPLLTRHGPVQASVASILPVRDSATRNVEIVCKIETTTTFIQPGDAATLILNEIIEGEGIWLPTSALTASSRGLWAVYIAVPKESNDTYQLVRQELEILDQKTDRVFVRSPIEEGSLIVKDGMNRLVPGLSVHIKKSE
ncbi:MAG: efflux RND transporter periplasmic adaptor subunit [Chlamydiota bacterium]